MSRRLGFAALLLAACGSKPAAAPVDELHGGKLVYEQRFEGSGLPADWKTTSPAWTLRNGELHGQGAQNEGVWLQQVLPEKVRVTWKATAESAEGDLKYEVFTDGHTHQSGYIGIFGGWKNKLNVIARLNEHGKDRLVGADGKHVEQGHTYEMAMVRTDDKLKWFVDGQPFMTYTDRAPLRGPEHSHFGFNDWMAPVRFDDVRIYDLGSAP